MTYTITVDEVDGGYLAYIGEAPTPLQGFGETPLQAIRALCETLKEWPISGVDRWLATPDGVKLARQFVPGYDGGKPGGSS